MSQFIKQLERRSAAIAAAVAAIALTIGFNLSLPTAHVDENTETEPWVLYLPGGHGVLLKPMKEGDEENNAIRLEITGEGNHNVLLNPTPNDNKIRFDDSGVFICRENWQSC